MKSDMRKEICVFGTALVVLVALCLIVSATAAGQGKGGSKSVSYTVVYQNRVGDRAISHVASFTAAKQAGGFEFSASNADLEVDLSSDAGISYTPPSPAIVCGTVSGEPCIFANETDKVRAVWSAKIIIADCSDGTQYTDGLEAIAVGETKCGQYPHYVSDLPAGPNGSLNWAARMNSFEPIYAPSSMVLVTRTGTNTWWIETGADPGSPDCAAGDCAALTRGKQTRNAKGLVLEGFYHVPFAIAVTKN